MNRRRKILIVDDEPALQVTLKRILKRNGYDVQCASDGEKRLHSYLHWRPDLVITDIIMPKMNGLELAAAIRKKDARSRVLFMTAHFKQPAMEERYQNEFANAPNCKLLPKPFDYNMFLKLIRSMLED